VKIGKKERGNSERNGNAIFNLKGIGGNSMNFKSINVDDII
jgi:hypothetical protein